MADFNITISNSLNLFGPAPSNKWNAYLWNAFLWGEGTADLAVAVGKIISNALALSDALAKSAVHVISESIGVTGDMGSEYLTDAAGYTHVFPSDVTNAEDRDFPDWSSGAAGSPAWATSTAGSTTWS